jgi:hypothetical protein
MMKRLIAVFVGAALLVGGVLIVLPPLIARPVYSVPQLLAGLTPRHNVWGGRTVWVRAVAVLGYDIGTPRDTVVLYDRVPGASDGFRVSVKEPNATFALLSWAAWMARHVPWMRWMYGMRSGVYRVRLFQPTWCMSCSVGQLQ